MPVFPTHESPAAVTKALVEALDLVDFGVLLLSPDLSVRFMNRKQIAMWPLARALAVEQVTYGTLLARVADEGLYAGTAEQRAAFVAVREADVREGDPTPRTLDLTDGRRFVIRCQITPDGGRMLTYIEETEQRTLEEQERERALEDAQRRDAEMRFKSEVLESQGAHLAALAEAAEAVALQAVRDKKRLEEEMTERARLMSELRHMAAVDPLTGLFNRREFLKLATDVIQAAQLREHSVGVIMLDLDHFKSINDRFGHAVGDMVLAEVSARLSMMVRPTDVVGRLGGEEFALILPLASLDIAARIAERLRVRIAEEPVSKDGHIVPVTASVGLAMLRPDDTGIEAVLARADDALYQAKRDGRNTVCTATSVFASVTEG